MKPKMMKIIISSFKRLLGEALWAVKLEYMMIEITTKIAVYNKTQDVMRKATGRGGQTAAPRSPEYA